MEITHVVRGNEYLSSTPKYNLLYEAFGWEKPVYIHLPMVVDADGKKLSKRHGASSFKDLLDKGYLPEGVLNYLALLGWSPSTNDEIFSLEDLIKLFNPERISKSPAVYDVKKLNWVNAHYIKKMDLEDLLKITVPHLESNYDLSNKSEEWIKELVRIYQNHISHGNEIVEVTSLFFKNDITISSEEQEIMNNEEVPLVINAFKEEISNINDWTIENIVVAINNVKEKTNVKGKMLFMPIRIKVSGQMHGPELPNTIFLLGKELILNRLSK
jgi:nondiscriminating glutamyl-tRNA synthetase